MTQMKKEKRQAISGKKKKYSVKDISHPVLTTAREIPKTKGKILEKMCLNLSENITHNNRNNEKTYKSSMYLLGMLSYIENFTIPMNES